MFGCPPPFVPRYVSESFVVGEVDHQRRDNDEALALLDAHFDESQSRMNAHYDRGWRDVTFEISDMVYLKIQPFRWSLLHQPAN